MDIEAAIYLLSLFNEKAAKLEQSRFLQSMLRGENRVHWQWERDEGLTIDASGPDTEMTDAVTLTLRMFIQPNDPLCLDNMSRLYNTMPLAHELIARLNDLQRIRRNELKADTNFEWDGVRLKHNDILETFIYGDLSHLTPGKRATFEKWANNPLMFALLRDTFYGIVAAYIVWILRIRDINAEVLEHFAATSTVDMGNGSA